MIYLPKNRLSVAAISSTILWSVFLGSSCVTLKKIVGIAPLEPKVKLLSFEPTSFSTDKVEMAVVLDVFNPNDIPIELSQLAYGLKLKDTELMHGQKEDVVTFAPESSQTIRIPLSVEYKKMSMKFSDFLRSIRSQTFLVWTKFYFHSNLGPVLVDLQKPYQFTR